MGPSPWHQTCNMAYPRALLERLAGFDERFFFGGEDTDLGLRAREAGAGLAYVPEAVVWHAVHNRPLPQAVAAAWRWDFLPLLVSRHPSLRGALYGHVFWKEAHAKLVLAGVGTAAVARHRLAALAAAPYLSMRLGRPRTPRALARALLDLPIHLLIDGTEVATTLHAAVRERVVVV